MKIFTYSLIAFSLIAFFSASALAAPFLTCTPYTKDGSEPATFVVVLNGTSYTTAAVATGANQVWLHFDMAGKVAASNTLTVKAQNIWGDSAVSSPLVFTASPPAAPGGLSFSAN